MVLYSLRCLKCGREWEESSTMAGREGIRCCGERAETNYQASRPVLERTFYGSESVSGHYRFIPSEVAQKRDMMGEIGHQCIRDGGQVVFENRGQQQRFADTFERKVFARDMA